MLGEHFALKWGLRFLIASFVVSGVNAQSQSNCLTLRQEDGLCVPITTCATIKNLLDISPKLRPSIIEILNKADCGTFNDVKHVCCDPKSITNAIASAPASQSTTFMPPLMKRLSVDSSDADADEGRGMAILNATGCGQSDNDRIGNGEDSILSEYPWMALLVYNDDVTKTIDCGGSLITDRYVLSAAHCIRHGTSKKLVSVRLGEHDTEQTIDCIGIAKKRCAPPVQEIDIEETVCHPKFRPAEFSNDIGLIRLIKKAQLVTSVQPICLPITDSSRAAKIDRVIIAGWGNIENGQKATVLQRAVIPMQSNDLCKEIHQLITITETHLCAGGENSVDTCKGDSGGPMFFTAQYGKNIRWVQYGIVGGGSAQCGNKYPSVFARVASYVQWIASNLKD